MPKKAKIVRSRYFADNVKKRRTELGLTQSDVARALDVDRTSVTYYELGLHEPNITNLIRLSNVLKTDMIALTSYPIGSIEEESTGSDEYSATFNSSGSIYKARNNSDTDIPNKTMSGPKLTDEEVDIITIYRQLSPEFREKVVKMMDELKYKNLE